MSEQQIGLLKAAIGSEQDCVYCGVIFEAGDGPNSPCREHIRPKSHGVDLNGGNRALVCKKCNGEKGQLTLVEFLIHLIRNADDRAGYVADYATQLFATLGAERAAVIVGLAPLPLPPLPAPAKKGVCRLPHCQCVGACEAARGR